jgi:hypothetical protein
LAAPDTRNAIKTKQQNKAIGVGKNGRKNSSNEEEKNRREQ